MISSGPRECQVATGERESFIRHMKYKQVSTGEQRSGWCDSARIARANTVRSKALSG